MTLDLILIRHGHAASGEHNQSDFERVLDSRGIKEAEQCSKWLAEATKPEVVLVSNAKRTKQTAEIALKLLSPLPAIEFISGLYLAALPHLFEIVATRTESSLAIVGHNFGLSDFASTLLGKNIELSTAGAVWIQFEDLEDHHLMEKRGKLIKFFEPSNVS